MTRPEDKRVSANAQDEMLRGLLRPMAKEMVDGPSRAIILNACRDAESAVALEIQSLDWWDAVYHTPITEAIYSAIHAEMEDMA